MKRLLARPKVSNLLARTLGSGPFLKTFSEFIQAAPIGSVHFICTGNICRSPFAEVRFKSLSPLTVRSSGLHATAGRGADPSAIRVGSEFGADLNLHKTTLFDPKSVRADELLVVMEYEHLFEIERRAPALVKQTVLLGALTVDTGHLLAIADPWGKDDPIFRNCFRQIEVGLTNLSERLKR